MELLGKPGLKPFLSHKPVEIEDMILGNLAECSALVFAEVDSLILKTTGHRFISPNLARQAARAMERLE